MTGAERRALLLEKLAAHPCGSTSVDLAAELGWPIHKASSYLGFLFNEAKVTRERRPAPMHGSYLYRIKDSVPVIASPPSQWQPPLRIAARMTHDDATSRNDRCRALACEADRLMERETAK